MAREVAQRLLQLAEVAGGREGVGRVGEHRHRGGGATGLSVGPEFDRLFLASMIAHHQGALAMVADLFSRPDGGQDLWVAQFARGVDSDQRIEIARMTSVLQSL